MTFDCEWRFDVKATKHVRTTHPDALAWTLHARVNGDMRPIVTIYQRSQPQVTQAWRILHRLERQRIYTFDRVEYGKSAA